MTSTFDPPTEATPTRVVVLASDAIALEVLPELGARLHRLTVFGRDLLRTPDDPLVHGGDPFRWGGYVMAPWCNRIEPVATEVGGVVVHVPANSSDGTALHGQVYLRPWDDLGAGLFRNRGGRDGWPWPYETTLGMVPGDEDAGKATLRIEQVLTNLDNRPMPGGLGFHPWFRGPVLVRINADRVLPSNLRADDPSEPAAGDFDLRKLRPMPLGLDATWLDPGNPPVELSWPEHGIGARIDVASSAGLCIVAASPEGAGAVAVEPETHAPHGLRRLLDGRPGGMAWIAAGGSIRLTTTILFERRA